MAKQLILSCLLLALPGAHLSQASAQNPKEPTVADWCVFRPTFTTAKRDFRAGTAFLVALPGHPRPILVTAIHLLGPAGGLPKDVPPADVPTVVSKLTLHDCFKEDLQLKLTSDALVIADAAPLGKPGKAGDVLAFWGPEDKRIHPLELSTEAPQKDEQVWMVASIKTGASSTLHLHSARMVGLTEEGECKYFFNDSRLQLRGTSGAPILNASGKVVAINLGGGSQGGKLFGVGNPVERFKPFLEAAAKTPPKP